MAEQDLKAAVVAAIDVIDKAMGEMSAASQSHVISPIGAATKTAHIISPDALDAANGKVRGATQRLKDAVANANGRPAGDPFWLNPAPPVAPKPIVAPAPAKPSLFATTTAPKAPARPSWPGR